MPFASSFRPPLPFLPGSFASPLDVLPAAINHLLAAEPWARGQLLPHVGKTLYVAVPPFAIRLTVAADGTVERTPDAAAPEASVPADTTITLPLSALPRMATGGKDALMRDLRLDGDAEFAQTVSMLARHLRWDVEEDLSKVVGDAASHRLVGAARGAAGEVRRVHERAASGLVEYLLDENPHLVRPRAVEALADGVRQLRDDLARLEKRIDRLTLSTAARP